MAYQHLSHTEVTISHKAKQSGIYETLLSKGIFELKQELKELFSAQSWDMKIYPIAISQSEWDKFYGDRINYIYLRYDFKSITKYLWNDRGHLRPLIW